MQFAIVIVLVFYNIIYNIGGDDYKQVFETIVEQCGDESLDMVTDLLKFTYTHENLAEGLQNGCEVIIYNIPFYYALRASLVEEYDDLLTSLRGLE